MVFDLQMGKDGRPRVGEAQDAGKCFQVGYVIVPWTVFRDLSNEKHLVV